MKKSALLSIILVANICFYDNYNNCTAQTERKKVAVVLSGGGAKGSAHVGALKVLEQSGIPIDMIVGTSMGALVGGLYSIGYSADMLDSLLRIQDWQFLFSDRIPPNEMTLKERKMQDIYMLRMGLHEGNLSFLGPGLIKGKNISDLFTRLTVGYHQDLDFNTLPIPFACVATDLTKFKEVDFHSGHLALAMRASMSIPAVFSPVELDSMVLADGGLKNNYPADVAKLMGADVIIGISVQNNMEKTPEYFTSAASIVNQLMDVNTINKLEENIALTDVFIKVNIDGYSAASFSHSAIDTLIERGEQATMEKWQELMELKERIGVGIDYQAQRPKPYRVQNQNVRMKISDVEFNNISNTDIRYLCKKFNLKAGSSTDISTIERAISALRGNLFYDNASYSIKYNKDGYGIKLETDGKKAAEIYMGVRFDNEEIVSMQLCSYVPLNFFIPTLLQTTLRLGKRSLAQLQGDLSLSRLLNLSISYTYRYNDINVYWHGDKDFNPDYLWHQIKVGTSLNRKREVDFQIFALWDYYRYKHILSSNRAKKYTPVAHTYSYHANFDFDSRLSKYFSMQGTNINLHYGLYTDNLYQFDNDVPISIISYRYQKNFRLNKKIAFTPMIYGRNIFGKGIPTVLMNCAGGEYFGHYLPQQVAFAGIGNVEIMPNNFSALDLTTKYRLTKNNYLSLSFAGSFADDKLKDIFSSSIIWGTRLGYAFNSLIGPLGASLGYSNHTKKAYLFVNIGYEF